MSLHPVTVSDNELISLLSNQGNYDRKVEELTKLLDEINKKVVIANTLKAAEKLKSQAEALMTETRTFQQLVKEEDDKQRTEHKTASEKLKTKEAELESRLSELVKRENACTANTKSLDVEKTLHLEEVQKFEEERQVAEDKVNEFMDKVDERAKAIKEILKEANSKLSNV